MRFLKIFLFSLLFIGAVGIPVYYVYFHSSVASDERLFEVESPAKKEIEQKISATGVLKLKDQVKVGSVVTGRVKDIYVKENDVVTEGQLLAEIDTGLSDTEVREALGAYEKALAEFDFQEANYRRQEQLFDNQFISDATLEESKRNYRSAQADVKALKATYEKKVIAYQNNSIYAPASGVVIHLDVAKGEKISSDLEGGTLLSLAPDVNQIEVELQIHEKDIGQIRKGQKVEMVVDTYPNRVFESLVQTISFTPDADNATECIYQAKGYIDNQHMLLRPGMNVNATIEVATVNSALTISSKPFLIKEEHLQSLVPFVHYEIKAIDKKEKQDLIKKYADQNLKFVWKVFNQSFQELPIVIGLTDNLYFEIKSGLKGDEELVADVIEDDKMQKLYEKFYRKF